MRAYLSLGISRKTLAPSYVRSGAVGSKFKNLLVAAGHHLCSPYILEPLLNLFLFCVCIVLVYSDVLLLTHFHEVVFSTSKNRLIVQKSCST